MEGLNDFIRTAGTIIINEKNVQINYERTTGKLPTGINASCYDESGMNVNVNLDTTSGKFNYSVSNTTASAATTATLIQAIKAKLLEIQAEIQATITA